MSRGSQQSHMAGRKWQVPSGRVDKKGPEQSPGGEVSLGTRKNGSGREKSEGEAPEWG